MQLNLRAFAPLAVCAAGLLAACSATAAERPSGPLYDYVSQADDSYKWVERQRGKMGDVEWVELTLTSQTWRDIVWKHQMFILKPTKLKTPGQAMMLVSGGAWKDELEAPPGEGDRLPQEAMILSQAASRAGAPIVLLSHVPQQPIFDGKTEDAIISYTFEQYLKTQEADWPLLLPMVKSAVRAMDATQEFAKENWDLNIENFTITGASKRGWTTWLTGAADDRVNAIAPIVIDVLNMPKQMEHQLAAWGEYSEQIADYTERDIQSQSGTDVGQDLNKIVDPYSYLDRLDETKLIVIGTNDRYWPLDALNLYWDDLQGKKYILYVPNNGHGVNDFGRLVGTLSAFNMQAGGEITWPDQQWDFQESPDKITLSVKTDKPVKKAVVWLATAPTRDFREVKWTSLPLEEKDGQYTYTLETPAEGYAALFGEMLYNEQGVNYYLSTNVRIIAAPNAPVAELKK